MIFAQRAFKVAAILARASGLIVFLPRLLAAGEAGLDVLVVFVAAGLLPALIFAQRALAMAESFARVAADIPEPPAGFCAAGLDADGREADGREADGLDEAVLCGEPLEPRTDERSFSKRAICSLICTARFS